MPTWWEYCRTALLSLSTQRTVRVVLAAAAISAGRRCVTHFFRTADPFSRLCSSCLPARVHQSARSDACCGTWQPPQLFASRCVNGIAVLYFVHH